MWSTMRRFALQALADAVTDRYLLHRMYCQELPATLDSELLLIVRSLGVLSFAGDCIAFTDKSYIAACM